jgi:hypothetical protein
MLRRPSELDRGLILADGLEDVSPENPYSQHFYKLDPFTNLPDGKVVTLEEFVGSEALQGSEFFREHLAPVDIRHVLGVDIGDEAGLKSCVRLMRGRKQAPFGEPEKAVLRLLVPHLCRGLGILERLLSVESERSLLAGAVSELAVACILLDQGGRMENRGWPARSRFPAVRENRRWHW